LFTGSLAHLVIEDLWVRFLDQVIEGAQAILFLHLANRTQAALYALREGLAILGGG